MLKEMSWTGKNIQSFQSGRHGGRQPPVIDRTGEAGRLYNVKRKRVCHREASRKILPI